MHGGVKFYRGAPGAARAYAERYRFCADDYYLGEGAGVATRLAPTPEGVELVGDLTGDAYEQWVAGIDIESGKPKGRLRKDPNALRFVEVTVNGPKTWSLAAALHPEISAALDAAQDRAAAEIIGWVAAHATTRVGPRDRQVQVPVERIEAAVIRHYTSRAGDPHRHLHLQISARVWAAGAWRDLHSVGIRDSIEAINGSGTGPSPLTRSSGRCSPSTGSPSTPRLARSSSWRRTWAPSALAPRRSAAMSSDTRPSGDTSIRARNRSYDCERPGIGAPGRKRVPIKSSRRTVPSSSHAGTARCVTSLTATPTLRSRAPR